MRFFIIDLESKWKMYYGLKIECCYLDEDMYWKEGYIVDYILLLYILGLGNEKYY